MSSVDQRGTIRLVVFDLDGTLLRGETVCETLARPLGKLERMHELEKADNVEDMRTARDEIVGWYRGHTIQELRSYLSGASLAPGAVEASAMLRRNGVRIGIASLTWGFAVEMFAELFEASGWLGSLVDETGILRHCWPSDKADFVLKMASELSLTRKQISAVGDSWGDIEMLQQAEYPIFLGKKRVIGLPPNVVHMPHADIREVADRILRFGVPE